EAPATRNARELSLPRVRRVGLSGVSDGLPSHAARLRNDRADRRTSRRDRARWNWPFGVIALG
ncbi:MAG TPA: hypothetical protein PKW04_01990, partial [Novosphingobium sp.]|nr:hypothetical protein [Novosphingobium sp.]HQQ07431.1 hypothetical protein [Novosphingobium sp.]